MVDGVKVTGLAADAGAARYGEQPLAQTVAAAAAIRRLTGMLLSLEHPHPTVDAMLAQLADWETELAAAVPPDNTPRVGLDGRPDQRVYLAHAFDVGAFNPAVPEYEFEHLDAETASGTVTFPLVYEGPPGLVHGGFLAVFFDCVIQHQSCAVQRAGRTRSLLIRYRRPTPILTPLRFDIVRSESDRGIESTARLMHDDVVLCTGEVATAASAPEQLSGHRLSGRRPAIQERTR